MVRPNSIPGYDTETGADSLRKMTTEERAVLAWERIADELTLLNQSFEHFLDRDGGALSTPPEGDPADLGLDDSDLSAASVSPQHSAADRENHHPLADNFSVAGHNYPNLQRAFKQPGRAPLVATDGKGDA